MHKQWSIRFRLLVALNASLVVLLLPFLVFDYRRELSDRVSEKTIALDEEAKTLSPGLVRIRPRGFPAVQEYIDSVCGAMREGQSPAAMTAAIRKTVIHHATEHYSELRHILAFVNRHLIGVTLTDDFVAMAIVQWQPETRQFRYANAGHEPAWLIRSDGTVEALPSTGLLLGVDEAASWDERSKDLSVGDQLVLLTDGVSEAANAEGELFGRKRVAVCLQGCGDCSAEETVQCLSSAMDAHLGSESAADDVTILGLKFSRGGA